MNRPLAVGDIIHGFANGAFGRDSYDCRIIEAVGPDWIVTRNKNGNVEFAAGRHSLELCQINRERLNHYGSDGDPCCTLAPEPPLTTWEPS